MIRIHTLGGFSVRVRGSPAVGAATQPRRLAVLAIVAAAGDRGVSRDKVLALLWPDLDDARGRHALKQAVYTLRRDLGARDLFTGSPELRLNPQVATSDLVEFRDALNTGSLAEAVEFYSGVFLDGFRLPGAAEFERWLEEERSALAHSYGNALERLARQAAEAGDRLATVEWWRRLAAFDPLDGRVAEELMHALVATGDRSGALRHERVYRALLEQELDLEPAESLLRLSAEIRTALSAESRATVGADVERSTLAWPVSVMEAEAVTTPPTREVTEPRGVEAVVGVRSSRWRRTWKPFLGVILGGALSLVVLSPDSPRVGRGGSEVPLIIVGEISGEGELWRYTGPVADMLATNLARSRRFPVVSAARLQAALGRGVDGNAADLSVAARHLGASTALEGTLYRLPGSDLRLDLRHLELATGRILGAYTVSGRDLYALVDSGTVLVLADLGFPPPPGPIAEVTTHSLVAYRFYTEGLARLRNEEREDARRLFEAALREDSTFAMAAFQSARTGGFDWRAPEWERVIERLDLAARLAEAASERERLIIRGWRARIFYAPELREVAEMLAERYPHELDGHLYLGTALVAAGDFSGAIPHLDRVVELDSARLQTGSMECTACTALRMLVRAYTLADSLAAAEREARRWIRLQPESAAALRELADLLDLQGRYAEARAALEESNSLAPGGAATPALTRHWLRQGLPDRAERLLRERLETAAPREREQLLFYLALTLRHGGRLKEALRVTREFRNSVMEPPGPRGSAPPSALLEAQVLFEMGRAREAAAIFDSTARWQAGLNEPPSSSASFRVWAMAQAAGAHALLGDSTALATMADSIQAYGVLTYLERDHKLHHHLRGLLASIHREDSVAADQFERATYSPTGGFNRTNFELARTYLRMDRPHDAIGVLRPIARGAVLEGSNANLTLTEIHHLLALAWRVAGEADSAAVHERWVARAWRDADPGLLLGLGTAEVAAP